MPYISGIASLVATKPLSFGAQQVSSTALSAETGEVSPSHLLSSGATYVILGHSECRARGETSAAVAEKLAASVKAGMVAILCVGEKERDETGASFVEVATLLRESLVAFPLQKLDKLIVAYEPLWAIGEEAERAATPRDFEEMAMLIRRTLSELFPKAKAFSIPLLYGGSVQSRNISQFLDVGAAGVLVGRASLNAKEFSSLITVASLYFDNNKKK